MISTTTIQEQSLATRSEPLCKRAWPDKVTVDISLLLKSKDEEEPLSTVCSTTGPPSPASVPRSVPTPVSIGGPPPRSTASSTTTAGSTIPTKRHARPTDHPAESPAKRQSKWSSEEDAKIIQLRGDGMKWEDISKHLPGRSAISCRLHYQNYLERRSEWDEDRKNKLARLYERFKADMWAKIAEEMAIPWRAAEAMHWQMGEHEMARRAGVTPFSMTTFHSSSNHGQSAPGVRPVHIRSNSSTSSHVRRDGAPRMIPIPPPQLPSLAELTASIPSYSAHLSLGQSTSGRPQSYHGALTPPHLYHHPGSQSPVSTYHVHHRSSISYPNGPPSQ